MPHEEMTKEKIKWGEEEEIQEIIQNDIRKRRERTGSMEK